MATDEAVPSNSRVSTKDFYEALLDVKKEMSDMERRIMEKLDCAPTIREFTDLKGRFDKHEEKDKKVDTALGAATIVGSILGVIFGTHK